MNGKLPVKNKVWIIPFTQKDGNKMTDTKFLKAYCSKTGRYVGLEVKQVGSVWKVVNVIELSADEARVVSSEVKQATFETNSNLIACRSCGSRRVGGCGCAPRRHQCSKDMRYQFDCVYCEHLNIDYSLPTRTAVSGLKSDSVVLSQGKEVKVITFSNVEWTKFDNIKYHQDGSCYKEPQDHVIANEESIEFHGYNISKMDEGVYYVIGKNDDFEIECDVDTSTIKPHPGGEFYVSFGLIEARISETGGQFYLDGKPVAQVGSQFNMKLSLTEGGKYEIFINGKKCGSIYKTVWKDTKITFGFSHDSHHCELLSHAYITGIKMKQGVSQQ